MEETLQPPGTVWNRRKNGVRVAALRKVCREL
jgi:hypothetical protein